MRTPNNKKIASLIAENLCSDCFTDTIDTDKAAKHLEKMVNIPELKPILEIISLAVEGKQATSAIPLLIVVDVRKSRVKDFTAEELDAPVLYKQNKIYLAGNQSSDLRENQKINQANLLFAMTQFVIEEVFRNQGKPYGKEASNEAEIFNRVCKDTKHDQKFIPTFAQLIFQHGSDCMQMISPDAMAYFKQNFLPACKDHLQKLYQRQVCEDVKGLSKFGKFSPALPKQPVNLENPNPIFTNNR